MGGWQSTMTKAGVMILLVLATFTITQVDLRRVGARSWPCEDYTCNHNGPESRIVYPGERCEYRVQPFGFDSYPPPRGVDCVVDYYPGDGCKQLVFNCKSLHLHNPHPVTCHGPDKMNVSKSKLLLTTEPQVVREAGTVMSSVSSIDRVRQLEDISLLHYTSHRHY